MGTLDDLSSVSPFPPLGLKAAMCFGYSCTPDADAIITNVLYGIENLPVHQRRIRQWFWTVEKWGGQGSEIGKSQSLENVQYIWVQGSFRHFLKYSQAAFSACVLGFALTGWEILQDGFTNAHIRLSDVALD